MIPFTQYLMPDGRPRRITIERPAEIEAKASEIIARGWTFEAEMLSDYATVSLTVSDGDCDVAIEVASNGPEIPNAIDRLVLAAHSRIAEAMEASDSE